MMQNEENFADIAHSEPLEADQNDLPLSEN